MTTKLQCVRGPKCKGDTCGWDAHTTYNPVTQKTELSGEYDHGWCSECGNGVTVVYGPPTIPIHALKAITPTPGAPNE
jgi:hypothetical protein